MNQQEQGLLLPNVPMPGTNWEQTTPLEDLEFVQKHPFGRVLLSILEDNTRTAQQTGARQTNLNIGLISKALKDDLKREEATIAENVSAMADKEINLAAVNQDLHPPQYFSPTDRLVTLSAKKDAHLTFPYRHPKFSGSNPYNKDHGGPQMAIEEYLDLLTRAQSNCPLSRREFIDVMLATTTGRAHSLIMDWTRAGESIEQIFHLLLMNYDRRISPTEAKDRLYSYRCQKTDSLAKSEAQILTLATRFSDAMPDGPSKNMIMNFEANNALMRALPTNSAVTASNLYHTLCSKKGRAPTFSEFTSHLNIYADSINRDIKQNGMETTQRKTPQSSKTKNRNPPNR
ncbi:MAG: hypothetical protein EHM38_08975, partial [Geobacteraceae bacterium]